MNLSEVFIRRPVMTVLLNAAIVVAGVIDQVARLVATETKTRTGDHRLATGVAATRRATSSERAQRQAAASVRHDSTAWSSTSTVASWPASDSAAGSAVTTAIASTRRARRSEPSTSANIAWASDSRDPRGSAPASRCLAMSKLLTGTIASVRTAGPPVGCGRL